MQPDPFGNLTDWGSVLEQVYKFADEGSLSEYQHGLIRILRYRDNWRLREEVLKQVGTIENPEDALVRQVLNIFSDEQLYYEVRILAIETMLELLNNDTNTFAVGVETEILKTVEDLLSVHHPPLFEPALKKLHSTVCNKLSIV